MSNEYLSAIDELVSGPVFPHTHRDWVCHTWKLGIKYDTREMWQYIEGAMAGAHMFYRKYDEVRDDLDFLHHIAFKRRYACED